MIERLRSRLPSRRTATAVLSGVIAISTVGGVVGYNIRGEPRPIIPTTTRTAEAQINLDAFLNSILSASPFTPERRSREFKYLAEVLLSPTLAKIDRGLWVASDPDIRIYLLNERYALRQEGQQGLKPIPPEMLQWIKDQGINPETLGIARDNYLRTLRYAQQLIDQGILRDDKLDDEKKITADESLMNPGGMAQLIAFETGGTKKFVKGGSAYGFSNIGEGIALDEINDKPDAFPDAKPALRELAQQVSKDTSLNFSADKIQGSLRGNPDFNLSGGAISIQFMPDRALAIYKLVKEHVTENGKPVILNIFDINDATVMGWLYLARHEINSGGTRYGYWKGHPLDIKAALAKWNPFQFQIDTIYDAAVDYYARFINGKPEGAY